MEENLIKRVVETFYKKAINDPMIGYHFRKIQTYSNSPIHSELGAFAHHIPRICTFWEMQLLGKKSSEKFELIKTHLPLQVKKGQVSRWVNLFRETLLEEELNKNDRLLWEEKLNQFEQRFLKSSQLFSS